MEGQTMDLCIYCGCIATERDHLHARSLRLARGQKRLNRRGYAHRSLTHAKQSHYDETVSACTDCNRALKDFPNPNIRERAAFLTVLWRDRQLDPERLKWLRAVAFLDLK